MSQSTRRSLFVLVSFLLAVLWAGSVNARAAFADDQRNPAAWHNGGDVRQVQQTLRDEGYDPGPIDGIHGPRTRSALRKYQKHENLRVTGRLDPETARKIEETRLTRFRGMDANNDGIITRQEYRGNDQSFANHDWNANGVLSGEEVTPGAHRPERRAEGKSVGEEFKDAGKEMGRGSQEAAHEMKKGKPVAAGKEFGKGVGRSGKQVGKGLEKAASTESDRGNREKKK